jgi:hypothetical protein
MTHIPVTATLIAKMKRVARNSAKRTGESYSAALEEAARAAGFSSWFAVLQAKKQRVPAADAELPLLIDPQLPKDFFETRNESRSARQLKLWWDRPFAQASDDGQLTVWCLDGGAWDRPTWYGVAKTVEEATRLARSKLETVQRQRAQPTLLLLDAGKVSIGLLPQHPHDDWHILRECKDTEEATRLLEELRGSSR